MEDRFIVKNNSGNVLMLSKNRITFAVNGIIDLAQRLNKTVSEIKRDPEIARELNLKNLIKIEEFDSTQNADLGKKLDTLINLMSSKQDATVSSSPLDDLAGLIEQVISKKIDGLKVSGTGSVARESSDEETMREAALMKLLKDSKAKDGNLNGLGGDSREVESDEDNSDLIDF